MVSLVLFGPKGLAQAAKSIGETLRAFAPTIRELTQVSSELKSTLEEEIGLNDLREEFQRPIVPSPRPPKALASQSADEATPSSSVESLSDLTATMKPVDESMAVAIDPEIERKRREAEQMAWGGQSPTQAPTEAAPDLAAMSVEELEAELARRKAANSNS